MKTIIPAIGIAACMAFVACDDNTSAIGPSLVDQDVDIVIDSSYTVTGRTVTVARIKPKTTQQLLGRVDIPAYGSLESSNIFQFLPSTALDTADFTYENVDSLILTLRYARGAFYGDSLAPMQITAYKLRPGILLPDTISSGFDPSGWYEAEPLGTKVYNTSTFDLSTNDKIADYRDINIHLDPTDELGKEMFKAFEEHPEYYADGHTFARNVFPGLYLRTSYGNGRMTVAALTTMSMYLRKIYIPTDSVTPDTLDAVHTYYMVTPEVLSNNNLTYHMAEPLRKMIDEGHTVMVAPAATEIELEFPLPELIASYRKQNNAMSVINSLTLDIPADSIVNGFNVTPPPYVLLVLKKDRDEFFAENRLNNNRTSFYATYSSSTGGYYFSGLQNYLAEMLEKEEITADDYTFSLVPVQINFENMVNNSYYSTSTEQSVAEILPYLVKPVMADIRLDKAKIKFSYSLQSRN